MRSLQFYKSICSLMASCAVTIVPVSGAKVKPTASPASAAPLKVSASAAKSQTVTLHFPPRSVGKIIFASPGGNWVTADDSKNASPIPAKGDVQLSTQQPVIMVLNYDGAAKSSFLDSPEMVDANVVQIDCRNVESANDDTLKYMTHLTKVKRLLISGTDITDAGLKYVSSMKALIQFAGGGTLIKGPGLAFLSDLPILSKLEVARSNFKGFKFDQVPTFKKLEYFTAAQCLLDDSLCEFIARQPLILDVDIAKNKITDAGIARLVGLKHLRKINLCDTLITPKCITSLSKIPSLLSVTVILGQLPPDAVAKMKKAMPKCQIELKSTDTELDPNLFSPLK